MNRIKTKFTIKSKLIAFCYLIVMPILLLISMLLIYQNYNAFNEKQEKAAIKSVEGLTESLEVLWSGMIELLNYLSINGAIEKVLKADNAYDLNRDSQLWNHNAPMEMIQDMLALKGYIKTIAIYPENGVRPYLRCIDASAYYNSFQTIKKNQIYKDAVAAGGKMIFLRVDKADDSIYETIRTNKIVLCRELYDLSQKKKMAYIAIGADAQVFEQLVQGAIQNEKEGIAILGREGNVLICCGNFDEAAAAYFREEMIGGESGLLKDGNFTYEGKRYFFGKSNDNGTYVIKHISDYDFKEQFKEIIYSPLLLLLGVSVGLLPVLVIVSNIITKPLRKLQSAMEHFKKGDFTQRVEITTTDEIGEIALCFNDMVQDIDNLIEQNYAIALKEKESELTALQAQINPHFLYNTLDSLYWQAVTADNEEIAENILALAQLFRMVLGEGKGEISLQSEIELVKNYLVIQKMRFAKRLNYIIDIDENVYSCIIPKLILQPFVENSIVHGFECEGNENLLEIRGYEEESYLVLIIHDTGVGMTKEQLNSIFTKTDECGKGLRIGKYAVKNVYERLQLKYKEDFVLQIESEPGDGTTVTIKLPLRR